MRVQAILRPAIDFAVREQEEADVGPVGDVEAAAFGKPEVLLEAGETAIRLAFLLGFHRGRPA